MAGTKSFIRRIVNHIKTMIEGREPLQYSILMGLISSPLVVLYEIILFIFTPKDMVLTNLVFLVNAAVMSIQFLWFIIIVRRHELKDKPFFRSIIDIHPYLLLSIGVAIAYVSKDLSYQVFPFLMSVFAVSLIRFYPLRERVFTFTYAFITFNGMMYLANGLGSQFWNAFQAGFLILGLAYIYTSIQYQVDLNRRTLLSDLEVKRQTQELAIDKLKKAYLNLEQRYNITDAMLNITASMLKTDFFDEVLQMILDEAIKAVPKADAGSILISNGSEMEFRAAKGYQLKELQKLTLKFADIFQADLEDVYAPAIVVDLKHYDEKHLHDDKVILLKNSDALLAKSVLTCAFQYDGDYYGSINLDNFKSSEAFDESDKRLIKNLAKQIEIIITIHKRYGRAISQTRYDELTKACSRSYHQELLAMALTKAQKNGSTLSICFIDINDLKGINDNYGHETGDEYLRFFSDAIRKIAGKDYFFSRLGGDEFALVFTQSGAKEAASRIEKLREYLSNKPFKHRGCEAVVAFGCGIVSYPDDADNQMDLMHISDHRMYRNKAEIKDKSN